MSPSIAARAISMYTATGFMKNISRYSGGNMFGSERRLLKGRKQLLILNRRLVSYLGFELVIDAVIMPIPCARSIAENIAKWQQAI
jgi:hypothetical protein